MLPPVPTKDPTAVAGAIQSLYTEIFPEGDRMFIPRIFSWAVDSFTGRLAEYQAIDAPYHDFEHTLQGTLCMARLLRGRHRAGAKPALPRRTFELGMLAILFHDTGYLKRKDDRSGTGAKYTVTHVRRSAEFARAFLTGRRMDPREIQAVENMIFCTGFKARLDTIPFHDEAERVAGFALGTADLLGQMAAPDYVDKLPTLFAEFEEAARFDEGGGHPVSVFKSAEELRKQTPEFWEKHVRAKLEREFQGLYRFLAEPYPDGPNEYLERIERNMKRLQK